MPNTRKPNISDTEPHRYRTSQILNLSDSEPLRYQTNQIPKCKILTYQIPIIVPLPPRILRRPKNSPANPEKTNKPPPANPEMTANPPAHVNCGKIREETGQPLSPFPFPAHNDRQPLLARSMAIL
jgi:hypothetical protein